MFIADLLDTGKDNAIRASRLSEMAGIKEREVLREIARERAAGAEICADNNGFYLAGDRAELREFCRRYKGRALGQLKTISPLLKKLDIDPRQLTIEDLEKWQGI